MNCKADHGVFFSEHRKSALLNLENNIFFSKYIEQCGVVGVTVHNYQGIEVFFICFPNGVVA